MATYKVLQDVEAEDKLIGPLTLKQFIFAIITLVMMFLAFVFARINIVLAIPWLVPILFFGFMAAPIGRDQPNDVWLAARIRFIIKPKRRVWDQSGLQELVTITVPKRIEIQRTDGLNIEEVRSRLNALSATMDSRGWALKNVNVNLSVNPAYIQQNTQSDRIVDISTITPTEVPTVDVQASDDVLDPTSNVVAKRFDDAIKQQQQQNITKLRAQTQTGTQVAKPQDYSFITNQVTDPGYTTFGARVVTPKPEPGKAQINSFLEEKPPISDDEAAFLNKVHHDQEVDKSIQHTRHERVIHTPEEIIEEEQRRIAEAKAQADAETARQAQAKTETKAAPRAKLKELGQQSEGLSVASLASLAKHAEDEANLNDNDVISLH